MHEIRISKVSYSEESSSESLMWIDLLIEKIIIKNLNLETEAEAKILMGLGRRVLKNESQNHSSIHES